MIPTNWQETWEELGVLNVPKTPCFFGVWGLPWGLDTLSRLIESIPLSLRSIYNKLIEQCSKPLWHQPWNPGSSRNPKKSWHSILNSLYHKVILHTFFSVTANRSCHIFPCFPSTFVVVLEADAVKTSTWSMVLLPFNIINHLYLRLIHHTFNGTAPIMVSMVLFNIINHRNKWLAAPTSRLTVCT